MSRNDVIQPKIDSSSTKPCAATTKMAFMRIQVFVQRIVPQGCTGLCTGYRARWKYAALTLSDGQTPEPIDLGTSKGRPKRIVGYYTEF